MVSSQRAGLQSGADAPVIRALDSLWTWVGTQLLARGAEFGAVLFGITLRAMAVRGYPAALGYDYIEHSATIEWWTTHFQMPDLLLSRGSYHPQPYYVLGGLIRRLGGDWKTIQATSLVFGGLRLCLLWFALERYLPQQRLARLLTLWLAAVIPVSVMMDAMITQESLNNLMSVLFVVATLELLRAPEAKRLRRGALLGALVAAGLLLKVSNLVLVGFLGAVALLEVVQRVDLQPYERLRRTLPWGLAIGIALVVSFPQYLYNQRVYGTPFLDGWYKRPTADTIAVHAERNAIIDRRSIGYFVGFTVDAVRNPYQPTTSKPAPRFWSQLISSSYCDHFGYRFAPPDEQTTKGEGAGLGRYVLPVARASQASGIGIALVTVVAWVVAAYQTLRRREVARPAVLFLPLLGLVGAAYFATKYPYDFEGVVKGHYYHFVTPGLYALFGVATAWLLRRRATSIFGVAACLCLIAPTAYSLLCVFR